MEIFQFALSNENAEKNFWVTDLKKKSGFALLDDKDLKKEKLTKINIIWKRYFIEK